MLILEWLNHAAFVSAGPCCGRLPKKLGIRARFRQDRSRAPRGPLRFEFPTTCVLADWPSMTSGTPLG